jgi:uncharacterized membrane protein YkvA (DUF1232 family)
MWFLPFLAGAAASWFALEVFAQRSEGAVRQIDAKIDALKADLFPEIAGQAKTALREEIASLKTDFLPSLSGLIGEMRGKSAYGAVDWRKLMAELPGIAEALSMYYAMLDPDTPWRVRMEVAAALTYLLTPDDWLPDALAEGEIDDIAVIMYAYGKVQEHVKPEHIERAKAWLAGEGVVGLEPAAPMPQLEMFGAEFEEFGEDPAAIEEAFHAELNLARYGGGFTAMSPWCQKATGKVRHLTRAIDQAAARGNTARLYKLMPKRDRLIARLAEECGEAVAQQSMSYGAIHPGGEWEEYIVSGHRAPSHALPQFRRMGGRFYG